MIIHFYQNSAFPFGMAAAKRRLCYIKGLRAAGDTVDVVITNKVVERDADDGLPEEGEYNGVHYCYAAGKYKHKSKLLRGIDWKILDAFHSFFHTLRYIHKGEVVFVYLYSLWTQFLLITAASIKGCKVVKETCEHPSALGANKKLKPLYDWIEFHLIMPHYDGFVAISNDLKTFVSKYKSKRAKVIVVPILVDENYDSIDYSDKQSLIDTPYIIHTGTMKETKDCIAKILKVFASFKQETHIPLKLVFTGNDSNSGKCKYVPLINELGIADDVVLMGHVSDEQIKILQHYATMGIIYKSDNLQTRHCFPTKLGELLQSEVPVITTTVGDASIYLKNGESALIFEPDDENALINDIKYLMENKVRAKSIGQNGKKVAETQFNPIYHGKRLSLFFHSI